MARKRTPGLPSRKQILDFIATSDQPAGKREIARAFGLSGQDKIQLKALLKDMADEGLIDSAPGRAFHKSGGVPKVTVLRIVEADDSGNIFAVPEQWHADGPPPRLRVIERGRRGALGIGDRILARTEERGQGYAAHPMKKLQRSAELVLGVVRKEGERFWLTPVEKQRAARAGDQRPEGFRAGRSRPVRSVRTPAARDGARRRRARRSVRAAQLQPHRHPQARPAPRIPAGGDRRGASRFASSSSASAKT